MSDVPILVCACGKRLRAPGATPGRVGRCPSCGGDLRVPDAAPVEAAPEPRAAAPRGERPERPSAHVAARHKKRRKKAAGHETAIWDGLIKAPERPETRLQESLLYPLWGATGIALLVVMPPLLWFASVPFLSAAMALSVGQSRFGIGLLFLVLPASIGLSVLTGYTLLFLGRVAASSAIGEVHHPRWPDWELSSIFHGLGRWLWAGLTAFVVGGLPAIVYWVYCGDIDLFDVMILAELMAAGAVYALMALLASILHEDVLAANPYTVIRAVVTVGWGYAQPCLLAGFAVVVAVTVGAAAMEVKVPVVSAFLFWLFWVVVLYEAMVVLRVLGLVYHKHARALGWFRGRTGWGV